jgi:nitrite reductase (NO-forming)
MKKPLFFISVSAAVVLASVALVSCFDRNTGDKWESTSSKIATDDVDIDKLPKESFALLPPPQVPPPITRKSPARVAIEVEVREVVKRLSDGVDYTFWTFGGTVPGPMLRIREGDYVDFTLANHPSNKLPHNIDLHAVTGQGGGAEGSFTAPGHKSTFSFRALNAGLYVYHCATAPVGMHIANGMYGLILVEPKEGMPKVDREYYVMQGDFYTKGKFGKQGYQPFDMEKAIDERPTYVVFNGSTNSMTGDNALKAKVGETIRLYVGNGGPNLVSSFHVIGEIFDKVLVLVDHSIFRTFNKGSLGLMKVEGAENKEVYSGKTADNVYLPEGGAIQKVTDKEIVSTAATLEDQIKFGRNIYQQNCAACHQADGKGIPRAFPPLANSDYFNADWKRVIDVVKNGKSGAITVNGTPYNGVMPSLGMSEEDIANVLTYVSHSWGNKKRVFKKSEVSAVPLKKEQPAEH